MIDISTALYNILHSRYGADVRQSIHDGIYQINENANEAVQTAKAMGVGTAVTSSASSSTGYVAGNLYLNNSTWDLWKCLGTNSWQNMGNIKGSQGVPGANGVNYYIFIRYSQYYDGTDFTASPTASSQYMGVYYGTSATAPTNKQDYQWSAYVGAAGTSAYVHIRYSENADGSNFVSEPTANTKYVGFYSGTASTAPANKTYYTWSKYVGNDGLGSGDMKASEYAGSGVAGTVDKALALRITDGTVVSADTITTKISHIPSADGNINEVIIANGDGTSHWGAMQGGHTMLSTRTAFENNTDSNKVVDALVLKEWSNGYSKFVDFTITSGTNTFNNYTGTLSTVLQNASDDANIEFFFKLTENADGEYENLTLSSYKIGTGTDKGKFEVTVVDNVSVDVDCRIKVTEF